jgi:hypothetical protein
MPRWDKMLVGMCLGKYDCQPFHNLTKTYWDWLRNKPKHNPNHTLPTPEQKIKQRQVQTKNMLVGKNWWRKHL